MGSIFFNSLPLLYSFHATLSSHNTVPGYSGAYVGDVNVEKRLHFGSVLTPRTLG